MKKLILCISLTAYANYAAEQKQTKPLPHILSFQYSEEDANQRQESHVVCKFSELGNSSTKCHVALKKLTTFKNRHLALQEYSAWTLQQRNYPYQDEAKIIPSDDHPTRTFELLQREEALVPRTLNQQQLDKGLIFIRDLNKTIKKGEAASHWQKIYTLFLAENFYRSVWPYIFNCCAY